LEKKSGSILQDNVRYLLEEYYEGNVSEMQRETGVNRSVISELKNGGKTEVNSSTLIRFAEAGVNLNWLLTGKGRPFMVNEDSEISTELKEKQLLDNRANEIKKLVSDIEDQLSEQPHLRLDPDVQTALLELLKKAVR
jgi:phage repressor protein C with HTH and peptisase S24 domain